MKQMKDEKGAALILTVLIITLLMVGIMALFTQITNTTRQISTMEQQIDAQLVAEMGVTYYQKVIKNHQNGIVTIVNENISDPQKLKREIKDFINDYKAEVLVDGDQRKFEIELKEDPEYDEESKEIIIKFTSTSNGQAFRKSKSIDGQIILQLQSESEE
jgi:type II secretory pathway component PulK